MSAFPTANELMQARGRHMDNLNLLRDASKEWDDSTRGRGEATMANLMQQVYSIDAALTMTSNTVGGAA